ncbi:MAG TPA: hypothetical protein VNU72_10630, partial [Puia sp.]|nr:hypothetical protein [Puia sp.]
NMLIVVAGLVYICIVTGTINPYTFRGQHQKYYINTGDFLTGVSLDSSVTAAMINAFALFYFVYRDKKILSLAALVTVLLAGSNWVDLLVIVCAAFIFVFRTDRTQKAMIVAWALVIGFFLVRVSPENTNYARLILERVTGKNAYLVPPPLPNPKPIDLIERKEVVAKREASKLFVNVTYTNAFRDSLAKKYSGWNYSGRWIAWKEMGRWFRDHPARLLLGAGMGNFSSRTAYKTAAIEIDGGYPVRWRYIHPFFRDNYLYIYLYYHSNDQGQHSIVNKPNSVYGQLLGEYGLAGLLAFAIFYIGFFIRGLRSLSYGLPILLLMSAAFLTEYWFEQLSVVVLFELLMLLDRKIEEPLPEAALVEQSQSRERGAPSRIMALRFRHRQQSSPIANRQTQIKDT